MMDDLKDIMWQPGNLSFLIFNFKKEIISTCTKRNLSLQKNIFTFVLTRPHPASILNSQFSLLDPKPHICSFSAPLHFVVGNPHRTTTHSSNPVIPLYPSTKNLATFILSTTKNTKMKTHAKTTILFSLICLCAFFGYSQRGATNATQEKNSFRDCGKV